MKDYYYKFEEALKMMKNAENSKSKSSSKGSSKKKSLEMVDIGLANKNMATVQKQGHFQFLDA